jgi:hypothetical protein
MGTSAGGGSWKPSAGSGARFTAIDYRTFTGNGYFEPHDFRSGVATLRAFDGLGGRFWWEVEGTYGREDSRNADPRPTWSAGARGAYRLDRRTEVDVRYHYFSSLEAGGGFARGSLSAGLRRAW